MRIKARVHMIRRPNVVVQANCLFDLLFIRTPHQQEINQIFRISFSVAIGININTKSSERQQTGIEEDNSTADIVFEKPAPNNIWEFMHSSRSCVEVLQRRERRNIKGRENQSS